MHHTHIGNALYLVFISCPTQVRHLFNLHRVAIAALYLPVGLTPGLVPGISFSKGRARLNLRIYWPRTSNPSSAQSAHIPHAKSTRSPRLILSRNGKSDAILNRSFSHCIERPRLPRCREPSVRSSREHRNPLQNLSHPRHTIRTRGRVSRSAFDINLHPHHCLSAATGRLNP